MAKLKIRKIFIGTNNKGKLREIKNLLPKNVKIHSTSRYPQDITSQQAEADYHCRSRTEAQLKKWGVKYHKLFFGKPRANKYIDDRGAGDDFLD